MHCAPWTGRIVIPKSHKMPREEISFSSAATRGCSSSTKDRQCLNIYTREGVLHPCYPGMRWGMYHRYMYLSFLQWTGELMSIKFWSQSFSLSLFLIPEHTILFTWSPCLLNIHILHMGNPTGWYIVPLTQKYQTCLLWATCLHMTSSIHGH